MITRLLLALIFFLIAAQASTAQSSLQVRFDASFDQPVPVLRQTVLVASDLVTIGDLFDHAGRHAETAIFRSPAPGTRGAVPAHAIIQAAHNAGLQDFDLAGLSTVSVERAGVTMSRDDLIDLVETTLNSQIDGYASSVSDYFELTIQAAPSAVTISTEHADRLTVDFLAEPSQRSASFVALIRSPNGRDIARLEGRAERQTMVPVLTRQIARGEVIRPSDLTLMAVPAQRIVQPDTLVDLEAITGQAARRTLRPSLPLGASDLTAPLVVQRQQIVTLVYRQGALALTVRARAMDDGALGASIDVINLQSNRTVRGLVAGPGLVQVLAPLHEVAAATAPLSSRSTEITAILDR